MGFLFFIFPLVKHNSLIILNLSILALALIFYFIAAFSNPGYIVQKIHNDKLIDMLTKINLSEICPKCEIIKPIRSRHCFICNRCIAVYDHHCKWINNCVGSSNHFQFIIFIILLWVYFLISLILLLDHFILHFSEKLEN